MSWEQNLSRYTYEQFQCWSFSSSQHVQSAVKNVEEYRKRSNLGPLLKSKPPKSSTYRLEADVTSELAPTKASYY